MDKIPHSNTTGHIEYGVLDGCTIMINPGETKMVDAPASKKMVDLAPAAPPPAAPPPAAPAALVDILAQPVKDISELLGAMTEPELAQLLALEQKAPSPRVTLIKEIEANILTLKSQPSASG